jgi:hypothetical protein
MNPGGNVSALVYKKYLNEVGLPKTIGESIAPLFTKAFQERKVPVWQNIDGWNSLGEIDAEGYVAPPARCYIINITGNLGDWIMLNTIIMGNRRFMPMRMHG